MKYALLADLHSNLHALDACLEHARAHDAQQFAFLGDLVGYGGSPAQVLDRVMALVSCGALCVRGNHEHMALNPPTVIRQMQDEGAAWTHDQLQPLHRSFLENLPLTTKLEQDVLLAHASAKRGQQHALAGIARRLQVGDVLAGRIQCGLGGDAA